MATYSRSKPKKKVDMDMSLMYDMATKQIVHMKPGQIITVRMSDAFLDDLRPFVIMPTRVSKSSVSFLCIGTYRRGYEIVRLTRNGIPIIRGPAFGKEDVCTHRFEHEEITDIINLVKNKVWTAQPCTINGTEPFCLFMWNRRFTRYIDGRFFFTGKRLIDMSDWPLVALMDKFSNADNISQTFILGCIKNKGDRFDKKELLKELVLKATSTNRKKHGISEKLIFSGKYDNLIIETPADDESRYPERSQIWQFGSPYLDGDFVIRAPNVDNMRQHIRKYDILDKLINGVHYRYVILQAVDTSYPTGHPNAELFTRTRYEVNNISGHNLLLFSLIGEESRLKLVTIIEQSYREYVERKREEALAWPREEALPQGPEDIAVSTWQFDYGDFSVGDHKYLTNASVDDMLPLVSKYDKIMIPINPWGRTEEYRIIELVDEVARPGARLLFKRTRDEANLEGQLVYKLSGVHAKLSAILVPSEELFGTGVVEEETDAVEEAVGIDLGIRDQSEPEEPEEPRENVVPRNRPIDHRFHYISEESRFQAGVIDRSRPEYRQENEPTRPYPYDTFSLYRNGKLITSYIIHKVVAVGHGDLMDVAEEYTSEYDVYSHCQMITENKRFDIYMKIKDENDEAQENALRDEEPNTTYSYVANTKHQLHDNVVVENPTPTPRYKYYVQQPYNISGDSDERDE